MSIGDKVTWTHVRQTGESVRFSTRTGVIEKIGVASAWVRWRGRGEWIRLERLTPFSQKTELTKMVCEL